MLENYGKDAQITAMVDRFNWVILPLVNPDGYAYTWKSVSHVAVGKSRDHDVGKHCTLQTLFSWPIKIQLFFLDLYQLQGHRNLILHKPHQCC